MNDNREKPSVYIAVEKEYQNSSLLNNLCYGLEEEGIPFHMMNDGGQGLYTLAHQAAQASRLNVSLALGENNKVIIHHKKLEVNKPFFEKEIEEDFQAKMVASNAARLVKGIPIKEIPNKLNYKNKSISDILSDLDNINNNEDIQKKNMSHPNKQLDEKKIAEMTDYIYQKLKDIDNS